MTVDVNLLRFPAKHASMTAGVLARFLSGERLTSLDAVAGASTTRLAAVVHYLNHGYGWAIAAQDKATPCRDGRVAWVAEYHLPADVIELAMSVGAGEWCAGVRAARAAQRGEVHEAFKKATLANGRTRKEIAG